MTMFIVTIISLVAIVITRSVIRPLAQVLGY